MYYFTYNGGMAEELEDKYSRFYRNTGIDIQEEIATGGGGSGLENYYSKVESDAITDALDSRVTNLEENPGGGVTDHGALMGLGDDDHTQYLNTTRGDARYYTKAQVDTALGSKADTTVTDGLDGRIDALESETPLSATDTPRYLLFNTTWPARPADTRMTFYIGGDPNTDTPSDSIAGDVWIPAGL